MLEQTGQSSEVGDLVDDCGDQTTCTSGTTHQIDSERQVTGHVHGFETVGWVAVTVGTGALGNVNYEAGITAEDVTHMAETVNFAKGFERAPAFFANIASHNGWDSSQLRQSDNGVTPRSATFVIEEESCVDDETGCDGEYIAGNGCHGNAESIAWFALNAPMGIGGSQGHNAGYGTQANQVAGTISAKPYPMWHSNMGEVGKVEITTSWTQVVVQGDYRKPQVFCGVPSKAGGDAVACRIAGMRHTVQGTKLVLQNDEGTLTGASDPAGGDHQAPYRCVDEDDRDAWCFYIALQEPSCLDHWHTAETASWMVMEEGSWLSDNGRQIQVGHATASTGGWTWVNTTACKRCFSLGCIFTPMALFSGPLPRNWFRQQPDDNIPDPNIPRGLLHQR